MKGWLDRRLYPDHADRWDDALFRERILDTVNGDDVVLDLGAGAGVRPHMDLRANVARVVGLDPDERVSSNPFLHEAHVGTGDRMPFDDGVFHAVVSNSVLEHLADPAPVFAEVARVLRPGGTFLAKTPNRRHYVPLVARLTPQRVHERVGRRLGREEADTFHTYYRANTPGDVMRLAVQAGLEVSAIELIEGRPEYLRGNPATYVAGAIYERIVNASRRLERLRVVMVVKLRRNV